MSKQIQAVLTDYGQAFLACLITAFMTLNKPLLNLGWDDWKAVISAAVAAWLPVVLVALKRNDRYGRRPL